jgi:hypothetical protein
MGVMTAHKWTREMKNSGNVLAGRLCNRCENPFSVRELTFWCAEVRPLQSSLAFKRCKKADKSISYSERSLWPTRCNAIK